MKSASNWFVRYLVATLALGPSVSGAQPAPRPQSLRPPGRGPGLPYASRLCTHGNATVTVTWQVWYDPGNPVLVQLARRYLVRRQRAQGDERYIAPARPSLVGQALIASEACGYTSPMVPRVQVEGIVEERNAFGSFGETGQSSGRFGHERYCTAVVLTLQMHLPAYSWCTNATRNVPTFMAGVNQNLAHALLTEVHPTGLPRLRTQAGPVVRPPSSPRRR